MSEELETEGRAVIRVNALCIAALSLSILSALAPWSRLLLAIGSPDVGTLIDVLCRESFTEIRFWGFLFLAGLLALVLTPLGGLLEAAGAGGAILAVSRDTGSLEVSAFLGETVGLLAASLAILSIWYPNGDLAHRSRNDIPGRLSTIHFERQLAGHERKDAGLRLEMNAIAFAGLIIGLAAVFFDWFSYQPGTASGDRSSISILDGLGVGMGRWSGTVFDFRFALSLFVVGLIISVVSPLGAAVQWFALLAFVESVDSDALRDVHLEVGFVLALASCVALILSIFVPMWICRRKLLPAKRVRLLTFCFDQSSDTQDLSTGSPGKTRTFLLVARILDEVNLICLAGALLGIYALLPGLTSNGALGPYVYMVITPMGWEIFLIGTVLALFSPWAGFVQLLGLMMYDVFLFEWIRRQHPAVVFEWTDFDFNMATLSCFIVLTSVFLTVRSASPGRESILDRILIVRFSRIHARLHNH